MYPQALLQPEVVWLRSLMNATHHILQMNVLLSDTHLAKLEQVQTVADLYHSAGRTLVTSEQNVIQKHHFPFFMLLLKTLFTHVISLLRLRQIYLSRQLIP